MSKIKGSEILWFKGGQSVGLCTNSTLEVNAETKSVTTKDSEGAGDWSEEEISMLSWQGSSEHMFAVDYQKGSTYETLFAAMVAKEPFDVKIALKRPEGSTTEIGENGWSAQEAFNHTGKAIITSLVLTAQNDDYATYTCTFKGVGKLN